MENKGSHNEQKNNNNKKNNMPGKPGIILYFIVTVVFIMMLSSRFGPESASRMQEIEYSEFVHMLNNKKVQKVELDYGKSRIVIHSTEQEPSGYAKKYFTGTLSDDNLVDRLLDAGVEFTSPYSSKGVSAFDVILAYVIPIAVMGALLFLLFRMMGKGGGGVMGVGKSNAKVYAEKETGVTFKDVAGQEEAKESIKELVDFLHNPGKYTKIGAKLPKGALLVGPPGTGKTLLAKAVAGEANVPFFSLSGSDFVEMFVGVGASRVRDLFKQAQSQAPCIVFIDEIDAIGKSRDSHYGGGNDEREQTLNQLLSEMDGFDPSKGVVILAATNRPEVLDKALLRPGRFDRRVIVDKPDLKGRVEILKVHAKNVLMHDSVNLEEIALATSGAVGSDLANMINEAAILAVKEGRTAVTQADLFESLEVVIAGKEKKDRILNVKEKKIVAYHEIGHALVSALEKHKEPVQKITIVPRTHGALGYVLHAPEEESFIETKDDLLMQITSFCGGRAAEELVFNESTSGAANDIEKATSIARAMVTRLGMSDRFGLMGLESVENKYLDGRPVMNCGDQTAAEIDSEVMRILKECYDRAYKLLEENRDILDPLADYLIEKETITGKEFMEIYNKAKGIEPEPEKDADDGNSQVIEDKGDRETQAEVSEDKTVTEHEVKEVEKSTVDTTEQKE